MAAAAALGVWPARTAARNRVEQIILSTEGIVGAGSNYSQVKSKSYRERRWVRLIIGVLWLVEQVKRAERNRTLRRLKHLEIERMLLPLQKAESTEACFAASKQLAWAITHERMCIVNRFVLIFGLKSCSYQKKRSRILS